MFISIRTVLQMHAKGDCKVTVTATVKSGPVVEDAVVLALKPLTFFITLCGAGKQLWLEVTCSSDVSPTSAPALIGRLVFQCRRSASSDWSFVSVNHSCPRPLIMQHGRRYQI